MLAAAGDVLAGGANEVAVGEDAGLDDPGAEPAELLDAEGDGDAAGGDPDGVLDAGTACAAGMTTLHSTHAATTDSSPRETDDKVFPSDMPRIPLANKRITTSSGRPCHVEPSAHPPGLPRQ